MCVFFSFSCLPRTPLVRARNYFSLLFYQTLTYRYNLPACHILRDTTSRPPSEVCMHVRQNNLLLDLANHTKQQFCSTCICGALVRAVAMSDSTPPDTAHLKRCSSSMYTCRITWTWVNKTALIYFYFAERERERDTLAVQLLSFFFLSSNVQKSPAKTDAGSSVTGVPTIIFARGCVRTRVHRFQFFLVLVTKCYYLRT